MPPQIDFPKDVARNADPLQRAAFKGLVKPQPLNLNGSLAIDLK